MIQLVSDDLLANIENLAVRDVPKFIVVTILASCTQRQVIDAYLAKQGNARLNC